MKKGKKIGIFLVGCLALFLIGTCFAYWYGNLSHTNKLTANEMVANILEVFQQDALAKGTVEKKVSFKNTGSSTAFLRVSYSETWTRQEQEEKILLNNQQNGQDVADKQWTTDWMDSNLWVDGDDGWYYYKKVLQSGESTKPILESVSFPDYVGTLKAYDGADYQLYFRMELLQVSDSTSTLNSDTVNREASQRVFGREASIENQNVIWK